MTWQDDTVPRVSADAFDYVPSDGSDTMVFDDRARRLFRLPGNAAAIWAAIDGERSVAMITELVAAQYDTDAASIRADVHTLLTGLRERQLLDDAMTG